MSSGAPKITKEMLEKRAAAIRTGGKGTVRRTTKAHHRQTPGDDKKVQGTLKRLGVQPIGEVEEVQMMRADGTVSVFKNPKVQASMQTQCFVVSGAYETKTSEEAILSHIQGAEPAEAKETA